MIRGTNRCRLWILGLLPVVLVLLAGGSRSLGAEDSQANWVREFIEPPTDLLPQGENFTVRVVAFVNQSGLHLVRVGASVFYPFMEILDADYTVEANYTAKEQTALNFTRDSVEFSTAIMAPANITVTATVFSSMAGSFYLPTATLSVGPANWTEYRSNRVGPLTITTGAEASRLNEVLVDLDEAKESLRQLSTELKAARAELKSLQDQAEAIDDKAAVLQGHLTVINNSINRIDAAASALTTRVDDVDMKLGSLRGEVDAIRSRLEKEVTWILVAAVVLAGLSCAGAWVSAAYASRKPRAPA